MKWATVSEGKTDHIPLKNILIGFFGDKNLPVTRLLPEADEPVGWGNLLNYLSADKFRAAFEFVDYVLVQIDTDKCEEWKEDLRHIGDDEGKVEGFVTEVKKVLIKKIGTEFYEAHKDRILFAICVHDIECWLLPFNTEKPAHQSKMVNCLRTLEQIAQTKGISLHQKYYREGKHYDELSKGMRNRRELFDKSPLNPSLKIFVESLAQRFPAVDNK